MTAIAYQDWMQGGSWSAPFGSSLLLDISPLDNLVGPQLGLPWAASHGLADRVLVRQLASATSPVDVVALLDVRSSSTLSVRIAHGPDIEITPSTPVLEYATSEFTVNLFFLLPARIVTNALAFRFGSVAGSTYSVGRIWAGPLFVPPQSIHLDWNPDVVDPGYVKRSRGKQGHSRVRRRTRRLSLAFQQIPFDLAFGVPSNALFDFQQLGYRLGTTQPAIVLPRTRQADGALDLQAIHRLGMYCHLTQPIDLEHTGGNFFSATLEAAELL